MRIQLTIDHLPNQKLPVNYQYLISSWIYSTIHQSDAAFSEWLHEKGYELNGKKYKHFCFSKLLPQRYKNHGKEKIFELQHGPTQLELSFNVDRGAKEMIKGLFANNMIQLSSGKFNILGMISQVQLLPSPVFTKIMMFKAKTPICTSVGSKERKHAEFLHPTDQRYAAAFASNLVDKANAYLEEEKYKSDQVKFKLLSEKIKSRLWTIKGTEIKGYEYEFELKAPPALIEIGYYAGFGVQNSGLGMGMCEVRE